MSNCFPTYARAARDLRAREEPVTVATLAREMGIEDFSVRKYLKNHPDAREKLGVLSHGDMLASQYLAAAALLRAAGKEVTLMNLSAQLSLPRVRVKAYLRIHPELAASVGLTTLAACAKEDALA